MMLPNFFILGAPKCGTTSLVHWLAAHPEVFMSPVKEPHFYSSDLTNRVITSRRQYRRLFRSANGAHKAVGEASTWYLFSNAAVPQIEAEHERPLYIVMSRDPVAMAQSLHHHNLRVLHEDRESFADAWDLQAKRLAGYNIPAGCLEPRFLQYYAACSVGSLLSRLYERVDSARVLHITLEDMKIDPRTQYARAQSFLGLEDDERTEFPVINEARGYRSRVLQRALRIGAGFRHAIGVRRGLGLARFNQQARPKPELDSDFVNELSRQFAHERTLRAELLERYK